MNDGKAISKLNKDVEEFVLNKIKNIKNVDEIFVQNRFLNIETNYETGYEKLLIYKKILQLTLNVYHEYDLYKDLEVKFAIDHVDLLPDDFCYRRQDSEDIWKCSSCPKKAELIKAVYNYVLCFLSIENQEKNECNKIDANQIRKCVYCEDDIPGGVEACPTCQATVDDMIIYLAKRPNTKQVTENFSENIDIEQNKDLNVERNDEPWERIEIDDVNGAMIGANIKYNELGVNDFKENEMTQKWKCGGCEYSNDYIHANCIVCGKLFEDGTWYCGQCTKENKGVNKACDACGSINSKVNVTVNDGAARTINNEVISNQNACDKCGSFTNVRAKRCKKCCGDSNIRADQWKCGKCSVIHGYGDKVCNTCDASRIGSGLWKCETCSMDNKCEDTKCGVCGTNNDYLSAKYCDKCKVNKVTHNNQYCNDCEKYNNEKYKPKQWKCQYPKCNEYNYDFEAYCSVCRLERHYSRARGDNVKIWYDNEEKIIWICHKCFKINKSHELVCHVCHDTRYKSKNCHKCRIYNDGTTNNCDQCYQKL